MKDPEKDPEVDVDKEKPGDDFKDAKQLKMEGFKPKEIEEISGAFEAHLKAKASKTAIDAKVKDTKTKLGEKMKEHKIPAYGYKHGGETFVATLVDKSTVTVKTASKEDRS